jgi:hypothetical protein
MKQILAIAFAFALAGTMLSGCNRDESRPAGAGGTVTTPSGSPSGSAGGTMDQDKQKRSTQPAAPGAPAGGAAGGASGGAAGTGTK